MVVENRPHRKPWPIIVAVLAITGIAIWLVPGEKQSEIADIPLPSGQRSPATAESPALPQTATATATATEGSAARALIAGIKKDGTPLSELVAKAQEMQAKGEITDAYLLYFYAARKGDASAALALGKQADPGYFSAGRSPLDKPDMEQAHKWYSVAKSAGNPEAAKLLAELRQLVESAASDGDPQAQRLALQWK